jgi:hypothetical protein
MATLLLLNSLNRSPYTGPPLTPRQERTLWALTLFLLAGLIGLFVWMIVDIQRFEAEAAKVDQAWDAGIGRPAAVSVALGQEVTVPATISEVNQYWDTCTYKTCYRRPVGHYPMVVPIGHLSLKDGCYVDKPSNQVGSLMVTTTATGGSYSVRYTGTEIRICSHGQRQDSDMLVFWSDDTGATR